MFTQISWGSYITIMVVSLIGYYLVIGYRYYRHDLLQLLSGKKITSEDKVSFSATPQTSEKQNTFEVVQSLSDEIQAFTSEAARNKINNDEIIQGLRVLLRKYPAIKDSTFREFIDSLIITESELKLSVRLSAEDATALWE